MWVRSLSSPNSLSAWRTCTSHVIELKSCIRRTGQRETIHIDTPLLPISSLQPASDHFSESRWSNRIVVCLSDPLVNSPSHYERVSAIRYDTVDLRALKRWRDGQLNLAHGTEWKNQEKLKNKNIHAKMVFFHLTIQVYVGIFCSCLDRV